MPDQQMLALPNVDLQMPMAPVIALPNIGLNLPVSASPIAAPRSRTPPAVAGGNFGRVAADVARQLWPDGAVDAVNHERRGNPRQWAREVNQASAEVEAQNNQLRLELAAAVRWIKLREQWWMNGVHRMQTVAGHDLQSLDLLRREGELDLSQRLSAMEGLAVRADQTRAAETARAESREASLEHLEARASEIYQQGFELRRIADEKVDALRAELSAAVEAEANAKALLASGNQRLADEVRMLQSSMMAAYQRYADLRVEFTQCYQNLRRSEEEMKSVKAGLVGHECGIPPEICTDWRRTSSCCWRLSSPGKVARNS